MCQVFISADPHLYECRVRSVRLHGVATSIRLENLFWNVLADIASRDGMRVPQLCTRLYDELVQEHGKVDNFASFLRVCCGRYLALISAGQISGALTDSLRDVQADAILPRETASRHARVAQIERMPRRALAH